jgi:hypothetical protein
MKMLRQPSSMSSIFFCLSDLLYSYWWFWGWVVMIGLDISLTLLVEYFNKGMPQRGH